MNLLRNARVQDLKEINHDDDDYQEYELLGIAGT